MRIYKITTRHSQLVDVSTPHTQSDISGVGYQSVLLLPFFYDSIIQGTWSMFSSASHYGNEYTHMKNTSNTDGDGIKYKVYLAKGTYTLQIYGLKGADGGIADIYIDNDKVATFDFYNDSSIGNQTFTQTGISVTSDSLKDLKIIVNGKNASSSGYYIYFSHITIFRTA